MKGSSLAGALPECHHPEFIPLHGGTQSAVCYPLGCQYTPLILPQGAGSKSRGRITSPLLSPGSMQATANLWGAPRHPKGTHEQILGTGSTLSTPIHLPLLHPDQLMPWILPCLPQGILPWSVILASCGSWQALTWKGVMGWWLGSSAGSTFTPGLGCIRLSPRRGSVSRASITPHPLTPSWAAGQRREEPGLLAESRPSWMRDLSCCHGTGR